MSRFQWRKWAHGTALAVVAAGAIGCAPGAGISPTASLLPSQAPVIPLPTKLPDTLSFDQTLPLFEYDRTVPFNVQQVASYPRGNASLTDLTYLGPNSVQMPAYLVMPAGSGPFPAVVWMGWTGNYRQIRDEFLDEAMALARSGVVSLLVSGYFPWYVTPSDKDSDRMGLIGEIRDLRRAIDFAISQPGVDPSRVAFVGHSMGAMHGLDLAAVDHRVKAAVLMAPHATFSDWIFNGYGLDASTEMAYRDAIASFDPLAFAPHAGATALFFQFAGDDSFVPRSVALALYGKASEPKTVGWYGGGHALNDTAERERDAWLGKELGFKT